MNDFESTPPATEASASTENSHSSPVVSQEPPNQQNEQKQNVWLAAMQGSWYAIKSFFKGP